MVRKLNWKSYKFQYFLWAVFLLALFAIDSYITSGVGDKQLIGSWSVRFLYEFSVILVLYSLVSGKITTWHLYPLTLFVHILIWYEWIDTGFKILIDVINNLTELEISIYPQMGLMMLAATGIILSFFVMFFGARTAFRTYAVCILILFSGFHALAHWQVLTNLSERTGLILDGYKKLSVINNDQFVDVCRNTESVCYSGKYSQNISDYKLVHRSGFNKDVPEHEYFQPQDFDGTDKINAFAKDSDNLSYTWGTNYLEFPTIDSPLKFVSYHKVGDQVFILIDDRSYLTTKQGAINLLKPFLFLFGLVWVIGGLGIFLMHNKRRS